jgi:hypothetical protein
LLSVGFAAAAAAPLYWQIWHDRSDPNLLLANLFAMPLWATTTFIAFTEFPKPRRRLWWLLLPGPICFWPLLQILFAITAWSINGFV